MTDDPQNKIKNVLIIELNEFNVELLKSAVATYSLPAIAKILTLTESSYRTQDRYNSGYLEPWVQWVSIHSGTPASQHKIKHLGDVPDLAIEQCWERLNKQHITTGVWGVMNGARRACQSVLFFLPDPWTFSEQAHPKKLNALLDLPRYVSKHYQRLNPLKLLAKGLTLIRFVLTSGVALKIIAESFKLLKAILRHGKKHYVFISTFDYISTLLFSQYKKALKPRVTFLFLNSLAHLQHHYWREGTTTVTPEILFGLQYLDKLFAFLMKTFPHDALVIHNGLSQMNTNHEKPWVLYRQKDPKAFLRALGIPFTRVEQHMTHDGHVFFQSPAQCQQAYQQLKGARLNGKPLFHVERNTHDDCKLFYQLSFTDKLDNTTPVVFAFNENQYPFFEYFDTIVTRTGRHVPMGTIFSDTISFPDQIYNHDFNKYLYHYLTPDQYRLREDIEESLEEVFE